MAELIYGLPNYYLKSIYLNNVLSAFDKEITNLENYELETKNQFIVDTATKSLPDYESEYGLPINPFITLSERRSRIKAKMRTTGTITKSLIENVVESWSNADVSVTEYYDRYEIQVEFVNILGIPLNMQDVYNTIREIIPAHLGIIYKFKYRRHEELRPFTHQYLKSFTHDTIRQGVI